jgi:nucleoid-associated protein YejK
MTDYLTVALLHHSEGVAVTDEENSLIASDEDKGNLVQVCRD